MRPMVQLARERCRLFLREVLVLVFVMVLVSDDLDLAATSRAWKRLDLAL